MNDPKPIEAKGGDRMTKFMKRAIATGAALAVAAPYVAFAQAINPSDTTLPSEFGLATSTDVREAIVNIIRFILGFLGLIAVIIVLYGGFQWMTAAGNEEKVSSARATLTAGLIGLVIILSAYALTQFVIGTYINVTNN